MALPLANADSAELSSSGELGELAEFIDAACAELAAVPFWRESAAGEYWVTNRQLIADALRRSASKEEFLRRILGLYVFTIHHLFRDRNIAEAYVRWQTAALADLGLELGTLDAALRESPFCDAAIVFEASGRAVSPEFLRVMSYAATIARHLPELPQSPHICEIGPGYGAFARVAALLSPGSRFVLLDLPESLVASYVFLSLSFPNRKVVLARSVDDVTAARDGADFLLVPVHLAESLRGTKIDLVVNTCSLGEMRNEVVAYWKTFITDTIETRFVFSWNRFMNEMSPASPYRSRESSAAFLLDHDWVVRYWEWDPPAQRAPYIDTLAPAYLCQIGVRSSKTASAREEDRRRSRDLLRGVLLEDWAKAASAAELPWQPVRTQNLHCVDGTQGGTLFKLWDSVRLCPNRVTVGWMLSYLRFLRAGLPDSLRFEEEHFLEALRTGLPVLGAGESSAEWSSLQAQLDAYKTPANSERARAQQLLRRRFEEALAQARQELEAQRAARAQLEQRHAEVGMALESERMELAGARSELAAIGRVLAEREATIAALEAKLHAMETSMSWRLTEPFRRLRNLIRERNAP